MTRRVLVFRLLSVFCLSGLLGCASQPQNDSATSSTNTLDGDTPESSVRSFGGIVLGEPVAVTRDFGGNVLIADRAPGQVVHLLLDVDEAVEFDQPPSPTGFSPVDLKTSGFFVFVVDPVERAVLRFYKTGSYLDVLIDLEERFPGRRVTPSGLDVDGSGRIALTDVKNHEIIIFNPYLDVELQFGNYGRYAGQFDTPQGVSFGPGDVLLVTDTGNRRVQLFDPDGGFVRMIPAEGAPNPMKRPRRSAMNQEGWVYVADPEAGLVFVFDENGALTRQIVPTGSDRFQPTGIALAPNGIIYVTDQATSSLYTFR